MHSRANVEEKQICSRTILQLIFKSGFHPCGPFPSSNYFHKNILKVCILVQLNDWTLHNITQCRKWPHSQPTFKMRKFYIFRIFNWTAIQMKEEQTITSTGIGRFCAVNSTHWGATEFSCRLNISCVNWSLEILSQKCWDFHCTIGQDRPKQIYLLVSCIHKILSKINFKSFYITVAERTHGVGSVGWCSVCTVNIICCSFIVNIIQATRDMQ